MIGNYPDLEEGTRISSITFKSLKLRHRFPNPDVALRGVPNFKGLSIMNQKSSKNYSSRRTFFVGFFLPFSQKHYTLSTKMIN